MAQVIHVKKRFPDLTANDFILQNHPNVTRRPAKVVARNRVLDAVVAMEAQKIKALTLPGPWWNFEKALDRKFRQGKRTASYVGVENNLRLFQMAACYIAKKNKPLKIKHSEETDSHAVTNGKNFCLVHGDIHKFIAADNALDNRYNVIWLDLNSSITPRLLTTLRSLHRWTSEYAIIALTVLAAREPLRITELMKGDRMKYIKEAIPLLLGGRLIDIYRYADESPMIQAIYQVGDSP